MSIAAHAVAEATIADGRKAAAKKPSANRIYTPVREPSLVPEPR